VIAGIADTHAALWYLLKNPRLSVPARQFMDGAAQAGHDIVLSPISLAEIVYLVEKSRLPVSAYVDLRIALADPEYVISEAPLNGEIVEAMLKISRTEVPDMPDRIIAATGIHFEAPVIPRCADTVFLCEHNMVEGCLLLEGSRRSRPATILG
jgi:PIN domain nuclease of toxin-antitoxin system